MHMHSLIIWGKCRLINWSLLIKLRTYLSQLKTAHYTYQQNPLLRQDCERNWKNASDFVIYISNGMSYSVRSDYIYHILHCKVLVIAIDKPVTVLGSAYFAVHLAAGSWIIQLLLQSPRMAKLWYKRTIVRPDFAEILVRMLHKCTNYTC